MNSLNIFSLTRPSAWLYVLMLSAFPIAEIQAQTLSIVNYDKTAAYASAGDAALVSTAPAAYWANYTSNGSAYSESTAMSPASGYTGPVFHGGYLATADTAARIGASLQVVTGGSNGVVLVQDYGNVANTVTMGIASAFVFKQQDWANYTSGGVSLSSISVNGTSYTNNTLGNAMTGRWIIENGSNYYISQTTFLGNSSTQSLTDFSTTTWAAYNPTTSLNFDQSAATYSTVTFDQVTGVGVYFENDSFLGTGASGVQYNVSLNSFAASAVPEPGTLSILLVAAACYLPMMRRFKKLV